MSESWKDLHIEWYADDLNELGYLFNANEWERFASAMNNCAMEFFLELAIDTEMFNLGEDGQ